MPIAMQQELREAAEEEASNIFWSLQGSIRSPQSKDKEKDQSGGQISGQSGG